MKSLIAARGGLPTDGYDETALLAQIWATQEMTGVVNLFNRDPELSERIRSGDVVVGLHRPIELQACRGAIDVGPAACELVRFVPPVVVGLLLGARLPHVVDGDLSALARAVGATRTVVVTLAEPGPPW